jgi:hypothetical protein
MIVQALKHRAHRSRLTALKLTGSLLVGVLGLIYAIGLRFSI